MNRDLLLRRMAEGLNGTVRDMAAALPWAQDSCGEAVKALRKLGHIECYGEGRPATEHGGGMPPKLWRITDAGLAWTKARFWWVKTWPVEVLR